MLCNLDNLYSAVDQLLRECFKTGNFRDVQMKFQINEFL